MAIIILSLMRNYCKGCILSQDNAEHSHNSTYLYKASIKYDSYTEKRQIWPNKFKMAHNDLY